MVVLRLTRGYKNDLTDSGYASCQYHYKVMCSGTFCMLHGHQSSREVRCSGILCICKYFVNCVRVQLGYSFQDVTLSEGVASYHNFIFFLMECPCRLLNSFTSQSVILPYSVYSRLLTVWTLPAGLNFWWRLTYVEAKGGGREGGGCK